MDRKYWEKIAPSYNEEIFDVLHHDNKKLIRSAIRKIASPGKTLLDAGCAVGKWLPILSPAFKKVYAVDISSKNLAIAQKTYPLFKNVQYLRADLSAASVKLPKADVIICINAILSDSMKKRSGFFKNIAASTKKNGQLLLVVPSLESWAYTHIIQNKWEIDKKLFSVKISPGEGLKKYKNFLQGNLDIDNVPTKHYTREELILLLQKERFKTLSVKKIEYPWTTEFVKPPKWLHQPYPWDWMVLAVKL